MTPASKLTAANLKTPRAAAIAGIAFAVLLLVSFATIRLAVPADPMERGAWLGTESGKVTFALYLVPVAGVAFLWFVGGLRSRIGDLEDRFVSTVFLGSGLLFLAMLFVAAAMIGAIVSAFVDRSETVDRDAFAVARYMVFNLINVYVYKMAAVFMITTSTIGIHTRFVARWIAVLGYVMALFLLFGSGTTIWHFVAFPIWILIVCIYILFDNFRTHAAARSDAPGVPSGPA